MKIDPVRDHLESGLLHASERVERDPNPGRLDE